MTKIQIQEFSTGIRYQTDPNGNWVSLGFTGQYINVTEPNIPQEIIRAIANKDFAVAERGLGHDPATIGREIRGTDSSWSVIALVSQGQDEKGRPGSFYRFLWCEGLNLASIIEWISNYQQNHNRQPVFNPNEQPKPMADYQVSHREDPPNLSDVATLPDSLPILLKPEDQHHDLSRIHTLAVTKANGQPISWAVNAEALEKPWNFTVIKAASDRAYQIFQKSIANKPKEVAPAAFDEQALKSAIKSLIGSSIVKLEAISTFMEALGTTQISDTYWNSLFDGQGAQNALDQNIYSPQMVRLLTLKLIAIPDFLQEYLKWIGIEDVLSRKGVNDRIGASLEFQSKIKNEIENSSVTIKRLRRILINASRIDDDSRIFESIGDRLKFNNLDLNLANIYYKAATYNINMQEGIPKKLWVKAFPSSLNDREIAFDKTVNKQRSTEVSKSLAIILTISSFIFGIVFGAGGLSLFQGFSKADNSTDNTTPIIDPPQSQPSGTNGNSSGRSPNGQQRNTPTSSPSPIQTPIANPSPTSSPQPSSTPSGR
jgi:hypothetical protein